MQSIFSWVKRVFQSQLTSMEVILFNLFLVLEIYYKNKKNKWFTNLSCRAKADIYGIEICVHLNLLLLLHSEGGGKEGKLWPFVFCQENSGTKKYWQDNLETIRNLFSHSNYLSHSRPVGPFLNDQIFTS